MPITAPTHQPKTGQNADPAIPVETSSPWERFSASGPLAALTVIAGCASVVTGTLWLYVREVLAQFYGALGVSLSEIGLDQATILARCGVVALAVVAFGGAWVLLYRTAAGAYRRMLRAVLGKPWWVPVVVVCGALASTALLTLFVHHLLRVSGVVPPAWLVVPPALSLFVLVPALLIREVAEEASWARSLHLHHVVASLGTLSLLGLAAQGVGTAHRLGETWLVDGGRKVAADETVPALLPTLLVRAQPIPVHLVSTADDPAGVCNRPLLYLLGSADGLLVVATGDPAPNEVFRLSTGDYQPVTGALTAPVVGDGSCLPTPAPSS